MKILKFKGIHFPFLNSRRKIDHSMVGWVLNASEIYVTHEENLRDDNVRCEILSAFFLNQYFYDSTLLSGLNLSKTRGRSRTKIERLTIK